MPPDSRIDSKGQITLSVKIRTALDTTVYRQDLPDLRLHDPLQ